jgi:flagellar motor protein MotB
MSELSNALQGRLNSNRKSHLKDVSSRQLDLFSSLTDRSATSPKIILPKPESVQPEREMVMPPPGNPPDVSADVRAVLSESGPVGDVDSPHLVGESHAPLRTGVYQRPRRAAAPPPPAASRPSSGPRPKSFQRIRAWFAGVEMDRRMIALIVVLTILVAAVSYWTARPHDEESSETPLNLEETRPPPADSTVAVAPASPAPAPAVVSAAPPAAPVAAVPVTGWKISGTEAVMNGGAILVRFNDPVFVSADKISIEGMAALKAVAAKLVAMNTGARVVVTGYTDNEPLTKPTPQFKSNADIAAARAKVAVEHLSQFARAGKGLAFEPQTGESSQAPYPNDTPQNRRLNRTVTVQVTPAP